MLYTSINPITGDAGLSPMIIILIIVCSVIIIGCIIWTILLNRKNSKIETTIITVNADEEIQPEQTIVESLPLQEETTDTTDDQSPTI